MTEKPSRDRNHRGRVPSDPKSDDLVDELEKLVTEWSEKCDEALKKARKDDDMRALGEGGAYDIAAYDLEQVIEEHTNE